MLFYFKFKILILYLFAIFGFLLFLIFVLIANLFNNEPPPAPPTIDNLIEKITKDDALKEELNSALEEFFNLFSNMNKDEENFPKWMEFIKTISLKDYMDVKEVALFRDKLIEKNPELKQEIEIEIANALKSKEGK